MGGSKKGEHRGNARKRPQGDAPKRTKKKLTHERPRDIMKEAVGRRPQGRGDRGQHVKNIEERIVISRVIHGDGGDVLDRTPKEVMLEAMHFNLQGARDTTVALLQAASLPDNERTRSLIRHLEIEQERWYDRAQNSARDVAPFVHPKQAAIMTAHDVSKNSATILHELLDEIHERQRAIPAQIEHIPKARANGHG